MPKMHDTRKQRARELYDRAQRGPSFSNDWGTGKFTIERAMEQYKNWSSHWLLHEMRDLIPELRRDDDKRKASEQGEANAAG